MSLPATRWTLLDLAGTGDVAALQQVVLLYRPAIVRTLQARGLGPDAEALAQEVAVELQRRLLAAPAGGRLRGLLAEVIRGVSAKHGRAAGPDAGFDREWVRQLLDLALWRLRAEHPALHEALAAILSGATREEAAARLGRAPRDLDGWIVRARTKLGGYLREEVDRYAVDHAEREAEIRFIGQVLAARGR